jgi:hypothetical protein
MRIGKTRDILGQRIGVPPLGCADLRGSGRQRWQAARSRTTKRHGSSLPWSGTRAAACRSGHKLRPVRHGCAKRLGRTRAAREEEVEGLGSGRKRCDNGRLGVGHGV